MPRRLPNLNQLRVFEAAARLGSFKAAAEELNVTQAAVSHQIKALEADLGLTLFHRATRKVEATPRAKSYAEALGNAFAAMLTATHDVLSDGMTGELRITAAPFYGNRIVLPRLPAFHAHFPELKVSLDMSADVVDLAHSDFDAGIHYGLGDWPGMRAILLHRDLVAPVAASSMLRTQSPPLDPGEIAAMTLGYSTGQEGDWDRWFTAAGAAPPPRLDPMRFGNRAQLIDLALSGAGVALADLRLMAHDIAAGRVVQLHPTTITRDMGMWVVVPDTGPVDPRIEAFATWFKGEILSVPP